MLTSSYSSTCRLMLGLGIVITAAFVAGAARPAAAAGSYKSLRDFFSYPNGTYEIQGERFRRDFNFDFHDPYEGGTETHLLKTLDGHLYGTALYGGFYGAGLIYSIEPNRQFSTVFSFPPGHGYPGGTLAQDASGALYGLCLISDSASEFYRYVPATGAFTVLHKFDFIDNAHAFTAGVDGAIYGMIGNQVFRCTPTGGYSVVHTFNAPNELVVQGQLCLAPDHTLYGTVNHGGTYGGGYLYRINSSGKYSVVYSFNYPGDSSVSPVVVGPDGYLWGSIVSFKNTNTPGVFHISTHGTGFKIVSPTSLSVGPNCVGSLTLGPDQRLYGVFQTIINNFTGYDYFVGAVSTTGVLSKVWDYHGFAPFDYLTLGPDNNLYATDRGGGVSGDGSIIQITPTGKNSLFASMRSPDGALPQIAPVIGADGSYYGITPKGGIWDNGVLFKRTPAGVVTFPHYFTAAEGQPMGLAVLPDGTVYGNTPSLAFKVVNGVYSKLADIYAFGPISASPDGNLYYVSERDTVKMAPDGTLSSVASLRSYYTNLYGTTLLGGDGNVYTLAYHYTYNDHNNLLSAAVGGALTITSDFMVGNQPQLPWPKLSAGPDGAIYGATQPSNVNHGSVFRYDTSTHTISYPYVFPRITGGANTLGGVTVKSDGTVVGVAASDHTFVYTISPTGVYTEQFTLPTTNDPVYTTVFDLAAQSNDLITGAWTYGGVHGNGSDFTLPGL